MINVTINKPKNLTQQLIDTLGLRIVSGMYPEGERLPSEPTLLQEFSVSRAILREVTKVLMAKGLVYSRTRVGTVVCPRSRWSLLDVDVLRWSINVLPEHEFNAMVFDVRMVYEPGAAAMAARNATVEDLERIAAAYEAMEDSETPQAMLGPDLDFHQAIMDATKNPFLSYIGRTLHAALRASIELTSRCPTPFEHALPRHKAVCDAILARDEATATAAAHKLLAETRRDYDKPL